MASAHFSTLATAVQDLKRVYLATALASGVPTNEHQELARAFVVLAHAELEWYVEEALRGLADVLLAAAAAGQYSKSSMALLTFTRLGAISGGTALSSGKKKTPRQLSARFGEAYGAIIQVLNSNMGVREKNLAAMGVPLGLDTNIIDNTWLNDLDAFCSFRGAYVHMSRQTQRATFQAVNPSEMWTKCERLIWTNLILASPNTINSFESFDEWIEREKTSLGPQVRSSGLRLGVVRMLGVMASAIRRRPKEVDDSE